MVLIALDHFLLIPQNSDNTGDGCAIPAGALALMWLNYYDKSLTNAFYANEHYDEPNHNNR